MSRPPPEKCGCCGKPIEWSTLRWDGTQEVPEGDDGPGFFLEFRTHDVPECGSTLGWERELSDADARRDAEVTRKRQESRPRWNAYIRAKSEASL